MEGLSPPSLRNPTLTYKSKSKSSLIFRQTSMKFTLAVSVAIGATLAQAAAVPTGLLGERCTPGTYYCNQSPVFECGTYYGAIVCILTHSSLLLIVLDYTANHVPQVICDDTGYNYTPIACCDQKRGCRVVNGEPHCM
jgi:hypothetical protein